MLKPHGKGKPLDLQPNANSISQLNRWKIVMTDTPAPPKVVFQPLTSWPAKAHPRQAEIEAYRKTPSLGSGTVDAIARDK